jgi:hypothetical protein
MNLYTYYDNGTWKAFEAEGLPVKPTTPEEYFHLPIEFINYNRAIAALKSKALPVGNPEEMFKIIKRPGIEGHLYEWSGAHEKEISRAYFNEEDQTHHYEEVYNLSLPEERFNHAHVEDFGEYNIPADQNESASYKSRPNMEKIDLHTTDSGKLYIKPEDLFAQDKVQEVIKKAAMKSETHAERVRIMFKQVKDKYFEGIEPDIFNTPVKFPSKSNMKSEDSIKEVLIELQSKVDEYSKSNELYFKGKKDAYEYAVKKLKRAIEWHKDNEKKN